MEQRQAKGEILEGEELAIMHISETVNHLRDIALSDSTLAFLEASFDSGK